MNRFPTLSKRSNSFHSEFPLTFSCNWKILRTETVKGFSTSVLEWQWAQINACYLHKTIQKRENIFIYKYYIYT
jgi:hypothetical protein